MITRNKTIVSRTLSTGVVLLMTVFLAGTAWGQQVPEPEGPYEEAPPPPPQHLVKKQKRPKKQQRRAMMLLRVLRQKVGLSEARAKKVGKIMKQFAPARRELRQKSRKIDQQLRQLLKADSNDDGAYKNALAELQAIRKELQALRDKELKALSKELTSKEQAKLMLALKQMKRRPGARRGQRGGPQMRPGNKRWKRRGPAARKGRRGMGHRGRRWRAQPGQQQQPPPR